MLPTQYTIFTQAGRATRVFNLGQFDPDSWIKLISGAGLGAAMAVFLLWKLFQDKEADKTRLDRLESFVHDELLSIIKADAVLNQQCLEVIRENTTMHQRTMTLTERSLTTLDRYEKLLSDKHIINQELIQELRVAKGIT